MEWYKLIPQPFLSRTGILFIEVMDVYSTPPPETAPYLEVLGVP